MPEKSEFLRCLDYLDCVWAEDCTHAGDHYEDQCHSTPKKCSGDPNNEEGYCSHNRYTLKEEAELRFGLSEIQATPIQNTINVEFDIEEAIEMMKEEGFSDKEVINMLQLIDDGEYKAEYYPPDEYEFNDALIVTVDDFRMEF